MSGLLRRAYGHGGTRLEHIFVSAGVTHPPPLPFRQKLSLVLLLLAVPVLISRYAIPTAFLPSRTLIDTSRITVKPPPPLPKPVAPEQRQPPPLERAVEPPPKTETAPNEVPIRTIERRTMLPAPAEVTRPAVSRSSAAHIDAESTYQPRVTRERRNAEVVDAARSPERLRREAPTGETPAGQTAIARTRGMAAVESAPAGERAAVLRRATPADRTNPDASGAAQRPAALRSTANIPAQDSLPHATAAKERIKISGAEPDGGSTAAIGLARGVSLMSLEICASSQHQEEAIKAVLSVVGSRQSCRDEKGEFQFKGTQRVSSFNLMIFPSKGRKPSHRCEELEHAYTCLKTH